MATMFFATLFGGLVGGFEEYNVEIWKLSIVLIIRNSYRCKLEKFLEKTRLNIRIILGLRWCSYLILKNY